MLKKLLRLKRTPPTPKTKTPNRDHAAQALASWLGALGRDVSVNTLRDAFPKNAPLTHAAVEQLAKKQHTGIAVVQNEKELQEALHKHPVLVHWFDPELRREQYTVVYEYQQGMYYLLDAHWGKRHVPGDVFKRNWERIKDKELWALALSL